MYSLSLIGAELCVHFFKENMTDLDVTESTSSSQLQIQSQLLAEENAQVSWDSLNKVCSDSVCLEVFNNNWYFINFMKYLSCRVARLCQWQWARGITLGFFIRGRVGSDFEGIRFYLLDTWCALSHLHFLISVISLQCINYVLLIIRICTH